MAGPIVRLLDGYPQAEGAKWGAIADITGPSSYTTGGFLLNAVSFGMADVEFAAATASFDGIDFYIPFAGSASPTPATSFRIIAYDTSNGLEADPATDLSHSHFRVFVRGI